jgi:hypothetical protein
LTILMEADEHWIQRTYVAERDLERIDFQVCEEKCYFGALIPLEFEERSYFSVVILFRSVIRLTKSKLILSKY